jgi:DnaA-homolog protein
MNNTAPFQLPLGVSLRDDARFENLPVAAVPMVLLRHLRHLHQEGYKSSTLYGSAQAGEVELLNTEADE